MAPIGFGDEVERFLADVFRLLREDAGSPESDDPDPADPMDLGRSAMDWVARTDKS